MTYDTVWEEQIRLCQITCLYVVIADEGEKISIPLPGHDQP